MINEVEEDIYEIVANLEAGLTPSEVADKLNCSISRVYHYQKRYKDAKATNTLAKLLDTDKLILASADKLVNEVPDLAPQVATTVKKLSGLKVLDESMQHAAQALVQQIVSHTLSVSDSDDLEGLTKSLCELRKAFFPANTQVNIQNNVGSSSTGERKYGGLISDKPAD